MGIEEKIIAYIDRAHRYVHTPWSQRDPGEYAALMALKAEILMESKQEPSGCCARALESKEALATGGADARAEVRG